MEHVGYSLVDLNTGKEIKIFGDQWGQTSGDNNILFIPPDTTVHCPIVGETYFDHMYVKRYFVEGDASEPIFDGEKVIVTKPKPTTSLSDLQSQLIKLQTQISLLMSANT